MLHTSVLYPVVTQHIKTNKKWIKLKSCGVSLNKL
jgi:hypothetical protein